MHTQLEDWKNGWYGIELGLKLSEIDHLIDLLKMLKAEPDQHFHMSSDYGGSGGLGDITIYVQAPEATSNMTLSGKAIEPGTEMSLD